jgi:hypothetical protein
MFPRKSEVFYLATNSYHITGHVTEHILKVLCSAFSPVLSEAEVPGKGLADLYKGMRTARYITDYAGTLSGSKPIQNVYYNIVQHCLYSSLHSE